VLGYVVGYLIVGWILANFFYGAGIPYFVTWVAWTVVSFFAVLIYIAVALSQRKAGP
jgi:hypothetical protein